MSIYVSIIGVLFDIGWQSSIDERFCSVCSLDNLLRHDVATGENKSHFPVRYNLVLEKVAYQFPGDMKGLKVHTS